MNIFHLIRRAARESRNWTFVLTFKAVALFGQNEIGAPVVKTFTSVEYDAGAQNWEITADKRGFIYVANTRGLLEYDGARWRLLDNASLPVRAMSYAPPEDRLYIGSYNDLGYYALDKKGERYFISLKKHLPNGFPPLNNVWATAYAKGKAYFQTEKHILVWDGKAFKIHAAPEGKGFFLMFGVKETIFVSQSGVGLLSFTENGPQLIPNGERFQNDDVYFITPFRTNEYLIGARKSGILRYDGRNFTPFTEVATLGFEAYQPTRAVWFADSTLAVATAGGGLHILDQTGRLLRTLDMNDGLADDALSALYLAPDGNMWVGTMNGLSRLEAYPDYTLFGRRQGVAGALQAVRRGPDGFIYAGGYKGVFRYEGAAVGFQRLAQIPGGCNALTVADQRLFVSTGSGIYCVENGGVRSIISRATNTVSYSPQNPNRLYVGLYDGFGWLENDVFTPYPPLDGIDVRSIYQASDKSIWINSLRDDIFRILPDGKLRRYKTTYNNKTLYDCLFFEAFGDRLMACSAGVFYYNAKTDRMEPHPRWDKSLTDGTTGVYQITAIGDTAAWVEAYKGERKLFYASKNPSGAIIIRPVPFNKNFQMDAVIAEGKTLWAAGASGLLRRKFKNLTASTPVCVFRTLYGAKDTVFFSGATESIEVPPFSYETAHYLRFDAAAPGQNGDLRYRFWLKGFDQDTSKWTDDARVIFSGLTEGNYVLYLWTQNEIGVVSKPAIFSFRILPPPERSIPAYFGYACLFGLSAVGVWKWRERALKRRGFLLEQKVKQRTQDLTRRQEELKIAYDEINRQKDLLGEQNAALDQSQIETKRAYDDLKTAQIKLVQTEKMNVLARLISGIAHELNTPMGGVKAAADNLTHTLPEIVENLPTLVESLDPPARVLFYGLIDRCIRGAEQLTTRQERFLKRSAARYLLASGFGSENVDTVAKELVKAGFFYNVESLRPFLEAPDPEEALLKSAPMDELKLFFPLLLHAEAEKLIDLAAAIGRSRHGVSNIMLAVDKTQKIIFALKSYAYQRSSEIPEATDVLKGLDAALLLTHNMLKHGVTLVRDFPESLPLILCNPDELLQVWCHIIDNAVYAMKGKGVLRVAVRRADDRLAVSFTDDGPGIPPEILPDIFEPFFTTKSGGEGVGLGLDTCRRVMERSGGTISVTSRPGETTFTVYLPFRPAPLT